MTTPVQPTDDERYFIRLFQGGIGTGYLAVAAGIWQAAIHKVHLAWQAPGAIARHAPGSMVPMALKVTAVGVGLALMFYLVAFWHLRRVPGHWTRVRVVKAFAMRSTITVTLASMPLVAQAVAYRGGYRPLLGLATAASLSMTLIAFPTVRGLARFFGKRIAWRKAQMEKMAS